MLNLSQTNAQERQEIYAITKRLGDRLADHGYEVYFFEHGSGAHGSLTGCGVDQAHLHIVPLPFDLVKVATARVEAGIIWQSGREKTPPLSALPTQGEYVALWSRRDSRATIGKVIEPVSQWIRRVIADELGIGAEWNYQTHPQISQVEKTLKLLPPHQTLI